MTTTINHRDDTRHHAGGVDESKAPDPEVPERSAGRRQFSAKYKAKILTEYEALPGRPGRDAARGGPVLLLDQHRWTRQRDEGATAALARPAGRSQADPRDREVARLKKEVERLEGELDKSRRVVEIQGKLSALLEQLASDSTAANSETR